MLKEEDGIMQIKEKDKNRKNNSNKNNKIMITIK